MDFHHQMCNIARKEGSKRWSHGFNGLIHVVVIKAVVVHTAFQRISWLRKADVELLANEKGYLVTCTGQLSVRKVDQSETIHNSPEIGNLKVSLISNTT